MRVRALQQVMSLSVFKSVKQPRRRGPRREAPPVPYANVRGWEAQLLDPATSIFVKLVSGFLKACGSAANPGQSWPHFTSAQMLLGAPSKTVCWEAPAPTISATAPEGEDTSARVFAGALSNQDC